LYLRPDRNDDFWKSYPFLPALDLTWGLEIYRQIDNALNLNYSRKKVVESSAEILDEIKSCTERLARLWPVIDAVARMNDDEKHRYTRIHVELAPSAIRLTCYDYQLYVDDCLAITQATIETRGQQSRDELTESINKLDAVIALYDNFLEPFRGQEALAL
jgi:hypothetical protein